MSEVKHVQFQKELNHKPMLRELAEDDDLEGIVVVCKWKDGTLTTGNSCMPTGTLALASLLLQKQALEDSFD